MGAIYRREIGAFFSSSIAYIFLAVFHIFAEFFFTLDNIAVGSTNLSGVFSTLFFISIFLIPILTMRLFSEEKKQRTEQGLLTAPVSLNGIVLGKYFAALTIFIIAVSIIFIYSFILSLYGTVAWLTLFANYLAIILVGSAFIAIGLFISSLTENQLVAAIGGIVSLAMLFLIDLAASYVKIDWLQSLL
ncbi:MAG: ABC transporter permease subunit, partial [Oscillospiraceae bacterium]|nr:ABC transporter permease subunit [Oscillospiraceae bacterium]